jgi:hypothetical protein
MRRFADFYFRRFASPTTRARPRARNNERATSFDAAVTAPRVDDRLAREDDDDDDDEMDARARARAWARLPTKTKCLGPTLLALGTAMLGTRALFALGAIEADAHAARGTTTALTVVGGMCALAGGYATTVMWMTARGARGWSYEMIPGE